MNVNQTGTVEVRNWGKWKVVVVQSEQIEQSLSYYRTGQVDGLLISPHMGYSNTSLKFLTDIDTDRGIGIVLPDAKDFDISILQSIPDLRFLTLMESTQSIDLSVFTRIQQLRIQWHSKLRFPVEGIQSLRDLYVDSYKPRSTDLSELPIYPNLEELEINQGGIENLSGIERFGALRHASFYHLRKLISIAALGKTAVEYLNFESCKNISDVKSLVHAEELKLLRFNNCGTLDDIDFIRYIPKIAEFYFVKTNILNGDLTPCLGLKSVGFDVKKHYSHTPAEMDGLLEMNRHS